MNKTLRRLSFNLSTLKANFEQALESAGGMAFAQVSFRTVEQAIKDNSIDRIKSRMDELTKASHKLAEEIYKQASQKRETAKPEAGREPKEHVIDAEYEETPGGG
jgi:uncharacterized protein (DUF4415 family)